MREGQHLPFELVAGINSDQKDHDPYVASDESFLIFTSERAGGKGGKDLYISYRRADGSWRVPQNMAAINTRGNEWCPMMSPDGRYLFFTRRGDIHWVDASIIEALRPKPPNSPKAPTPPATVTVQGPVSREGGRTLSKPAPGTPEWGCRAGSPAQPEVGDCRDPVSMDTGVLLACTAAFRGSQGVYCPRVARN